MVTANYKIVFFNKFITSRNYYYIFFIYLFLLPNLITIILPFIVIFGIVLCFLKLNTDNELVAIYGSGLNHKVIRSGH